jgi:hypothetical protein
VRNLLERQIQFGTRFARRFGSATGGVGYEIEDARGRISRWAIVAPERGFIVAIAPAVLAARAIVDGRYQPSGLVSPDQHASVDEMADYLTTTGITWRSVY